MSDVKDDIWGDLLKHPRWGHDAPEPFIIPWIMKLAVRGQKAMDLGCGWGRHLVLLAKFGFDAVGLDSSPGMLEAARERLADAGLKAELVESDASDIPFPAETFHLVLTTYAIHHGDRRFMLRCMKEIERVLVDGGHLVAAFPNINDSRAGDGLMVEPGTVIPGEGDPEEGIPHHFCTEDELLGWLKKFELIHFEETFKSVKMDNAAEPSTFAHYFVVARKKSGDEPSLEGAK